MLIYWFLKNIKIEIIPFKDKFAKDFYDLNVAWLEKYFYIEPYDEKVLSNPKEHIIKTGGFIFFAITNNEVVGTFAFINQKNFFELSKMAVLPKYQNFKIGQKLLDFAIDFAQSKKWKSITLYSHRKLETAIYIYSKKGFIEIPLEKDVHYERADIKMRLNL